MTDWYSKAREADGRTDDEIIAEIDVQSIHRSVVPCRPGIGFSRCDRPRGHDGYHATGTSAPPIDTDALIDTARALARNGWNHSNYPGCLDRFPSPDDALDMPAAVECLACMTIRSFLLSLWGPA